MKWKNVRQITNLTPHEIAIHIGDSIRRIPPSGSVVRLNSHCKPCGECDGIPVVVCSEGEPRGLPEPVPGVIYIVSSVVAKKVKRDDVLCPDTSDDGVIRDGKGYIVGVTQLQLFR